MSDLALSVACGRYDRTAALFDGRVNPRGLSLTMIDVPATETFRRMLRNGEFDVAEMSFAAFAVSISQGDDRWAGIPIFPSRMLRHRDIFVSDAAGITKPEDLRDRRVGIRRYHMTALVWQRGILSDDYGVSDRDVIWVRAEIDSPGQVRRRLAMPAPEGVNIEDKLDRSIDEMLLTGELDAGFLVFPPASFRRGDPRVRRLFDDIRSVELDYLRRTGIYPIMHLMIIKREIIDRHPWVVAQLMDAFESAKELALQALLPASGTAPSMLPLFHLDVEEAIRILGRDLWPYGVAPNRHVLETLMRYLAEQRLLTKPVGLDDLFGLASFEADGSEALPSLQHGWMWD